MSTLLKRGYCYPDGSIYDDDIGPTDVIPTIITLPVTIDLKEFGVCTGIAWVEQIQTTPLPRWMALLFFWCINPTITLILNVSVKTETKVIEFEFPLDATKSIHENLLNSSESFGIREVWINVDS